MFLIFLAVYITFVAVAFNYARAFRVKNKVIDIIEQNEVIDVAIKDVDGNVIGFVAVQWNEIMPSDIDIKNIDHLAWNMEEAVKKLTALSKEKPKVNMLHADATNTAPGI